MIKLGGLSNMHCGGYGVSHVFYSLCRQWRGPNLSAQMIVPTCEAELRCDNLLEAVPPLLRAWYYRQPHRPAQAAEKRFLRNLPKFDAAYLYPGVSLETVEQIKAAHKPIVLERVNCQIQTAKQLLDEAYSKLGLPPTHGCTPEADRKEQQELALADLIFCPSELVKTSFAAIGVPEHKLILTTEGWSPQRFPERLTPVKKSSEGVTVLFMGSICVRKGVHLLLQAWERSKIKGQLILVGNMEPEIAQSCADLLSRSDVKHVGFGGNYGVYYQKADVFAIASLEEGSPLVTYEAMAHGLPVLGSPMGAGGIVRDGVDGWIIPPYDQEAWVEALRRLADSVELREQMGNSARQRSDNLTWFKVAAKREALLLEKLRSNPALSAGLAE